MTDTRLSNIGQLHLRRILARTDGGGVVLEGTNAQIFLAGHVQATDIGKMAVCQDVITADAATLVVLGVLADPGPLPCKDAPIVLEHGKSSLRMYPDGRIEMRGEDIAVDSTAGLRLLAAKIDLN